MTVLGVGEGEQRALVRLFVFHPRHQDAAPLSRFVPHDVISPSRRGAITGAFKLYFRSDEYGCSLDNNTATSSGIRRCFSQSYRDADTRDYRAFNFTRFDVTLKSDSSDKKAPCRFLFLSLSQEK